jgi:hypothetical protein
MVGMRPVAENVVLVTRFQCIFGTVTSSIFSDTWMDEALQVTIKETIKLVEIIDLIDLSSNVY